jgi:hypothetical protein
MEYAAPPYVWLIGATIAIYNAVLWYSMNYLKRVHEDAWVEWGSPSYKNVLPVFRFVFGRRYRLLSDPRLTALVWAVRVLLASCVVLIVVGETFHLLPRR